MDWGVVVITAFDRIQRIKNRDMNNGHGPGSPAGSELLAKNARITRRHRRMIESRGIDRDFVPTMDRIRIIKVRRRGHNLGLALKIDAKTRGKRIFRPLKSSRE